MNSIVKFEMNPSASYLLLQRDSDKTSCSVDAPNLHSMPCCTLRSQTLPCNVCYCSTRSRRFNSWNVLIQTNNSRPQGTGTFAVAHAAIIALSPYKMDSEMNLDKKVKTKNAGPIEQRAVKHTREIACSPKPRKQRKENTEKDKTCAFS